MASRQPAFDSQGKKYVFYALAKPTKQARLMSDYKSTSDKCQEASFVASQVIAQRKQPNTVAQNLP